jgi:hypothetical protein
MHNDEASRREGPFGEAVRSTETAAARLVGLDEETAQAVTEELGCVFRVVRRDGVSLPVTMDMRSNRINATIEAGRVTAAEVG